MLWFTLNIYQDVSSMILQPKIYDSYLGNFPLMTT